jgi:hypothetical protein
LDKHTVALKNDGTVLAEFTLQSTLDLTPPVTWLDSTRADGYRRAVHAHQYPFQCRPVLSAEENVARRESSQSMLEGIFEKPWRDWAAENALDR